MRWRSAMVAGGAAGLVACAITAAYLASIEIDDGLEALIVVPLLVAAMGLVGLYGSWRGVGATWVVGAAAASAVPLAAVATWSVVVAAGEDDPASELGSPVVMMVVASVSTLGSIFGLACVAGLVAWGLGELVRLFSARRRRRAGGPA